MWERLRGAKSDVKAAVLAMAGYVGLGVAFRGPPDGPELRLFRLTNHHSAPDGALRVPQQLGTPWSLVALAAFGAVSGRRRLAVAAGLALPVEKGLEVGLKKILERPRPAKVDPQVHLRDDAPVDGPSYPSGHAAIAVATVTLLAPYLPRPVVVGSAGGAAVSGYVRLRQGAHFPTDVVGGAALGITVATALRSVIGS